MIAQGRALFFVRGYDGIDGPTKTDGADILLKWGAAVLRPYMRLRRRVNFLFGDHFEFGGGDVYGVAAYHQGESAGFDYAVHVAV